MGALASLADDNRLGAYLRDRRTRLDPAAFGVPMARRRTPGLRREEVAQRAHVSATWYTWLEQGRGGAPSADVLDRIARALMLTETEREYVFNLALGRSPEVRCAASDSVSPRLQAVLDALPDSPAIIRNPVWDVLAWNRAAAAVLTDYAKLEPKARNVLRLIFRDPEVRKRQTHWESVARYVVGAFRADVARSGAPGCADELVAELSRASPDFAAMWRGHDVNSAYGEAPKTIHHPEAGAIAMEYSSFTVGGRPDLSMIVYTPVGDGDLARVRGLMEGGA